MKRTAVYIFALIILTAFFPGCAREERNPLTMVKKWFILLNYSADLRPVDWKAVSEYQMAIVDPDNFPRLGNSGRKMIMIAYVSVGEAEKYRSYWKDIKDKNWIVAENPDWKDNFYVDVRSKEWRDTILDKVIPEIVRKGFKGIMMDTIDTSDMLEYEHPEKFKGADAAMVEFIKEIHERYPDLLLISNNGFSVLDKIAPYLSGMLVEDIHMMPDFAKGGYKEVPEEEYQQRVGILLRLRSKYGLPVFVIDYVSMEDKEKARECVEKCEKLGFVPYIAQKDLNDLYKY
ncbi:endo alpha-1,4 polygalactosaminidase [Candidatus Auribacterota bacterium]